jgi:hypothetical protein
MLRTLPPLSEIVVAVKVVEFKLEIVTLWLAVIEIAVVPPVWISRVAVLSPVETMPPVVALIRLGITLHL